jgi:hypothetical protein
MRATPWSARRRTALSRVVGSSSWAAVLGAGVTTLKNGRFLSSTYAWHCGAASKGQICTPASVSLTAKEQSDLANLARMHTSTKPMMTADSDLFTRKA